MRYKHNRKSRNSIQNKAIKFAKRHRVIVVTGLFCLIYASVTVISYVSLKPYQRSIFWLNRRVVVLRTINTITDNVLLPHIGANNISRNGLWFVSASYDSIGSPDLDSSKFIHLQTNESASKFIREIETWELQDSIRRQQNTPQRLSYATKMASAIKQIAIRNPENLDYAKLKTLNTHIQNDGKLGALVSEITLKNVSARLLAEHEHYQSFKDKERWVQRSNDLKQELSTTLDRDWQAWLTQQKTELEIYQLLLNNLSSVSD